MRLSQSLLWSVVVYSNLILASCDEYCITPSTNASYLESCVTLFQFAEKSSFFSGKNATLRLVLLPGNHSLNVNVSVTEVTLFSVESATSNPTDTVVNCTDSVSF